MHSIINSNKYVANVQIELLIGKLAIFAKKKFDSFYSIGRIGITFASETLSKKNTTTNQVTKTIFAYSLINYKRIMVVNQFKLLPLKVTNKVICTKYSKHRPYLQ